MLWEPYSIETNFLREDIPFQIDKVNELYVDDFKGIFEIIEKWILKDIGNISHDNTLSHTLNHSHSNSS